MMLSGRERIPMADNDDQEPAEITAQFAELTPVQDTTVPSGKPLGRAAAARLLGVSKTTLRRMEGDSIEPVVGPKNEGLFHQEQIQALVMTRRTSVRETQPTDEVAADVFTLLDEHVHPVDVIKQLRLAPKLVESLHQHWTRMRGMLVLSHQTTAAICEMLRDGEPLPLPERDADLLELAKKWVHESSPHTCVQCKGDSAEFCRACAKAWGLRSARAELVRRRSERL
jgi:hypothetical protein